MRVSLTHVESIYRNVSSPYYFLKLYQLKTFSLFIVVTISVRFAIPINGGSQGGQHLIFSQWLPSGTDEALARQGEAETRLWIDHTCVDERLLADNDISRWVNIMVNKVYVDVSTPVHDDLAQFIYDERIVPNEQGNGWLSLHEGLKPGDSDYDEFSKQYQDLGHKVLRSAFAIYNRFIAFARNTKGQYWLRERPYDPINITQDNGEFRAQVK